MLAVQTKRKLTCGVYPSPDRPFCRRALPEPAGHSQSWADPRITVPQRTGAYARPGGTPRGSACPGTRRDQRHVRPVTPPGGIAGTARPSERRIARSGGRVGGTVDGRGTGRRAIRWTAGAMGP